MNAKQKSHLLILCQIWLSNQHIKNTIFSEATVKPILKLQQMQINFFSIRFMWLKCWSFARNTITYTVIGLYLAIKKTNISDKYSFSINCNFFKFYCVIVTEPKFVKAQDLLKEPWIINHFLAVNIHVYLFCGQMKQIVSGSELGNEYSHAYLI